MTIPINTPTAPSTVLQLFGIISPEQYKLLQAAGNAPPYDSTKPTKVWLDPDALMADVTGQPDSNTGIWYLPDKVVYPCFNILQGIFPPYAPSEDPMPFVIDRSFAATINCPDPSTPEFDTAVNYAPGGWIPFPVRPLQTCEKLIPGPAYSPNPLVQNITIMPSLSKPAK